MSSEREYVTIVSGLPRSGTSLMMQMIDASGIPALTDNIRKADEDNPKGYYEFEPVKKTKEDASWLEQAVGKVVKMVHLLLMDLPDGHEYRVIFMRRHLTEVVRSQDVMLERQGKEGGEMSKEKLMQIFEAQLRKVELWVRERSHFKLLNVDYNEVIRDPKPSVDAINEFLGGDLDTDAMLAVVDPSLYRQRKENLT
ncbi:MAG: sulfotransferase domain-containing protein [Phycisphaerales bacterium]|nr:MAG: sulfotransferase domain-containing protein [Phycisphaerales bacterium]